MIDDYLDKKTLDRSDDFKQFRRKFDDDGSVFIYVNTPVMFNNMKKKVDAATRASMDKNKDYITCFRHIGFQLVPEGGKFMTLMAEQFQITNSELVQLPEEQIEIDSTGVDLMELPYIYVKDLNSKSYTEYYSDSTTVHFEVELKNGFKDGSFTEYYENGKEKMTGKFKQDKRDGNWRRYDEDGELVMRRTYEDGEVKRQRE